MPALIGLTGRAGVGKDTVADILVEQHGWDSLALADPLRESLLTLDPYVSRDLRLGDVISLSGGWDQAKSSHPEVRRLLQLQGDAIRDIDPEAFTRIAIERATDVRENLMVPVVITDVRYPDEAYAIRQSGGLIVRVVGPSRRPLTPEAAAHPSETSPIDPDAVIDNTGDMADLRTAVARTLQLLSI